MGRGDRRSGSRLDQVLRSMRNDRCMANWDDVGATALTLPEVAVGQAREGSPAYDVAGRQFARQAHPDLR